MLFAVLPALAQGDRHAASFWKSVEARCDATAAKPPSELAQRIAQVAIDEFNRFGGHRIDANGHLFRFGLTEAEHVADDGSYRPERLDHLGWWQVMKYWRALFGAEAPDKIEIRGYRDASASTSDGQSAEVLPSSAGELMRAAETISDPQVREVMREAALRGAIIDTPWSAAFISYVIKEAGAAPGAFKFSNAHRVYIYDAFAVNAAEAAGTASEALYRACPLNATKPRPGDLICQQREPGLVDESEAEVRERIRSELAGDTGARTVRRTHCEVVAFVDKAARKLYSIGGNVNEAVTARKLNLYGRGLKFSSVQGRPCRPGDWTLPQPKQAAKESAHSEKCSLNDRKWFVLLQVR